MLKIIRTDSSNPDFIQLIKLLDNYLKIVDGEEHSFYNQFNNINVLKHTIVAYVNNSPVGSGAFKVYKEQTDTIEIKRMYINPKNRNNGIASKILGELEIWAKELDYKYAILETGIRQVEAVNFYKKNNYTIIPSYGQYLNIENSICFKKELS